MVCIFCAFSLSISLCTRSLFFCVVTLEYIFNGGEKAVRWNCIQGRRSLCVIAAFEVCLWSVFNLSTMKQCSLLREVLTPINVYEKVLVVSHVTPSILLRELVRKKHTYLGLKKCYVVISTTTGKNTVKPHT